MPLVYCGSTGQRPEFTFGQSEGWGEILAQNDKFKKVMILQKNPDSPCEDRGALLPNQLFAVPSSFKDKMELFRKVEVLALQHVKYQAVDLNPLCICDSLSARVVFMFAVLVASKHLQPEEIINKCIEVLHETGIEEVKLLIFNVCIH